MGEPEPKHVSTSYVERQNLTMRMCMRRFTSLTNGFSKKLEKHAAAVAIHYMHYNFARIHKTLRITPTMAAGVAEHVWSLYPGKWVVRVFQHNLPALPFWRVAVSGYTDGVYEEDFREVEGNGWSYFTFRIAE